jgi:hypothetical protein
VTVNRHGDSSRRQAVKNTHTSWHKVTASTINGVWKQLTSLYICDFQEFQKTANSVISNKVDMGKDLHLDLEED